VRGITDETRPWWTVTAVALAMIVLTFDFFGLTVALPSIGRDLDASTATLEWAVNAYLLAIAAPLIAVGRLADIVGRRRMLLVGTTTFGIASIACAAAGDDVMLIVARVVQGLGGSVILATSLSIVSEAFPADRRATGIGVWSAIGSIGSAVGPFVGGVLTETLSWRWFFLLNVPVSVVAIALTRYAVRESRDDAATGRVDLGGFVTVTGGFVLLILGLQQSTEVGWASGLVLGSLGAAVLLFSAFVAIERRVRDPLVELSLFRTAPFAGASGVAFLAQWVFGAVMFFVTLYVQEILGLSPIEAGLVFLAFTIPFTVLSLRIGPIVRRFGAPLPMFVGMVLVGGGAAVLAFVDAGSGVALVIGGLVVLASGEGFAYNVSSTAAMDAVADQKSGIASGMLSTSRFVGMVVGLAITGALFRSIENREIATDLGTAAGRGIDEDEVRGLLSGSDAARRHLADLAPSAKRAVQGVVDDAFVSGFRGAMLLCVVIAVIGLPLALLGRRRAGRG